MPPAGAPALTGLLHVGVQRAKQSQDSAGTGRERAGGCKKGFRQRVLSNEHWSGEGVFESVLTSPGDAEKAQGTSQHHWAPTRTTQRHKPSSSEPSSNNWMKLLRLLIFKDLVTRITTFAFYKVYFLSILPNSYNKHCFLHNEKSGIFTRSHHPPPPHASLDRL